MNPKFSAELVLTIVALAISSVLSDSSFSVKIEDDVSIENCPKILSNLELLLIKTSEQLHSVTSGRLTIDHVDIQLPDVWSKSATCVQTRNVVTSSSAKKSFDFSVVKSSRQNLPWALQYGQCGVKGRQLFFPSSSLTAANSLSFSNVTFNEFVKYNFGVFVDNETSIDTNTIDDDGYDADKPTKQNLLCKHRSPLDVMLAKCKFNETTSGCEPRPFKPPVFTFSTRADLLTIVVIDRMITNSDEDVTKSSINWEIVQNAFFLFISKLPAGSAISIVTFGTDATLNLSPTLVTSSNAAELFAKIPRRHLVPPQKFDESCVKCGLQMALKIAASSSSRLNPSIVLLSKIPFYPTEEEFGSLPPIFTIGLTSEIRQSKVPRNENVRSFVLPECSGTGECLFGLSRILSSVSEETRRDDRKSSSSIFGRSIETDGSKPVSGRFQLPDKSTDDVWIVLTSNDEKDVETFELTDPAGRRYQFPKYEHGIAYFHLDGQRPAGDWSYTFKLYETLNQVVQLEVSAAGRLKKEVKSVKGWIEVDSTDSSKVILYAEVLDRDMPVGADVQVKAVVHRPAMDPVEIQLRDLGTGYPDLKKADGIFSAYFTKFSPEPGHYEVEIVAVVKNSELRSIAGSFYAEQATGFYIREGSSVPVNDVFPPSRITDLKVEGYLEESYFVYMSWSAPGGDFDDGKALRYEIRCSTNPESLRNDRYNEFSILVDASLVPTPVSYGHRQECTVGVPWPGQTFYYGIVAIDESGNRGEISNVVTVRIDKKEEPSVTLLPFVDETSTESKKSMNRRPDIKKSVADDSSLIAYISCSVVLVAALMAFTIWRIVVRLNRRSNSNDDNSDKNSSSSSHDENPNNVTTEDIWSLTSRSDDSKTQTKSTSTSLHFVTEGRDGVQQEFIYNDFDLLKDIDLLSSLVAPPMRDSVLEDMSVYRDLSNLDSQSLDYFALSRRLTSLLYCDDDSKRRESLV